MPVNLNGNINAPFLILEAQIKVTVTQKAPPVKGTALHVLAADRWISGLEGSDGRIHIQFGVRAHLHLAQHALTKAEEGVDTHHSQSPIPQAHQAIFLLVVSIHHVVHPLAKPPLPFLRAAVTFYSLRCEPRVGDCHTVATLAKRMPDGEQGLCPCRVFPCVKPKRPARRIRTWR